MASINGKKICSITAVIEKEAAPKLESKWVAPTKEQQEITPSDGYDGLTKVTITPIVLENKIVTPSKEEQIIEADDYYFGLGSVVVKPANSSSDENITPENIKSGVTILGVTGILTDVIPNKMIEIIAKTVTVLTKEDLEGLSTIGSSGFTVCELLKTIELPETVTSIGSSAFSFCTSLEAIEIPNSVEKIDANAFQYCVALSSIQLPNRLTELKSSTFQGCSALPKITIPASVEKIAQLTFSGCSNLTEVTVLATTPPTLLNKSAFPNELTTIYIPHGTLSLYESATNWSTFVGKFVELSE